MTMNSDTRSALDVVARSEASAFDTVESIDARISQAQEIGEGPLSSLAGIQKLLWNHNTEAGLAQNVSVVRDTCASLCQITPAPAPLSPAHSSNDPLNL